MRWTALIVVLLVWPAAGGAQIENVPRVELLGETFIAPEHEEFGRVGGLSGVLANGGGSFCAVSDDPRTSHLYWLRVDLRRSPDQKGYVLAVALERGVRDMITNGASDCEAIAGVVDPCHLPFYYAAFEDPPSIGVNRRTVPIPEEFAACARPNRGFESLCCVRADEGKSVVWAAMEAALTIDGPIATQESGTLCRVLEFECQCGPTLVRQLMYRTERKPPGLNVRHSAHSLTEMAAMPDGRVLALERSFDLPYGYDALLFVVDGSTHEAEDARFPVLNKALVVKFSELGLPALGNLEGMAVGPALRELLDDPEEEGYLLLMVADDNFGKDHQKTGSQVIALRLLVDGEE